MVKINKRQALIRCRSAHATHSQSLFHLLVGFVKWYQKALSSAFEVALHAYSTVELALWKRLYMANKIYFTFWHVAKHYFPFRSKWLMQLSSSKLYHESTLWIQYSPRFAPNNQSISRRWTSQGREVTRKPSSHYVIKFTSLNNDSLLVTCNGVFLIRLHYGTAAQQTWEICK